MGEGSAGSSSPAGMPGTPEKTTFPGALKARVAMDTAEGPGGAL